MMCLFAEEPVGGYIEPADMLGEAGELLSISIAPTSFAPANTHSQTHAILILICTHYLLRQSLVFERCDAVLAPSVLKQ